MLKGTEAGYRQRLSDLGRIIKVQVEYFIITSLIVSVYRQLIDSIPIVLSEVLEVSRAAIS